MDFLVMAIGLALLLFGANIFVSGAASIAQLTSVPPLLIGLTVVAFGTSAPEAAISINAAIKSSNELVLGNVIGSNMFNLLLAVGVAAMIRAIKVKKTTLVKEFPLSLYATALLLLLSLDVYLGGQSENIISRADGMILLLAFGIFLYYIVQMAFLSHEAGEPLDDIKMLSLGKSMAFFVLGLAAIIWGADLVVKAATSIALAWGISQTLVGLTIVAIGSSLPELVTAITAALKGENDIAMGNIIGSGLFNILFVLGISAIINPITIAPKLYVDVSILLLITLIANFFALTHRKIDRREGLVLALLYLAYIVFAIIRN